MLHCTADQQQQFSRRGLQDCGTSVSLCWFASSYMPGTRSLPAESKRW